jgi:hypothetical protein
MNQNQVFKYWLQFVIFIVFFTNIQSIRIFATTVSSRFYLANQCMDPSVNARATSCITSCDGEARVNVFGGSGPFYFTWDNGESGVNMNTMDRLCSGMHTLSIIDVGAIERDYGRTISTKIVQLLLENDCYVQNITYEIIQGTKVCGLSDGCGGIGGIGGTDGCDCPLIMSITTQPSSCPTEKNGIIRNYVAGGTPPYQIVWSNGYSSTVQYVFGGASYNVQVTDAVGRTISATVPVGVTSQNCDDVLSFNGLSELVKVLIAKKNAQLNLFIGTIQNPNSDLFCDFDFALTFESPRYTNTMDGNIYVAGRHRSRGNEVYNWLDDQSNHNNARSNLNPGQYYGNIQFENYCAIPFGVGLSTTCVQALLPCKWEVTYDSYASSEPVGNCTGAININVVGGGGFYDYDWVDSDIQDGNSFADNLCPGIYVVEVIDKQTGCTTWLTIPVEIEQCYVSVCQGYECSYRNTYAKEAPPNQPNEGCFCPLIINAETNPASCFNKSDGVLKINVSGGNTPYIYTFNGEEVTDLFFENILPGVYEITVEDEKKQKIWMEIPVLAGTEGCAQAIAIPKSLTDGECFGNFYLIIEAPSKPDESDGRASSALFDDNFYDVSNTVVWDDGTLGFERNDIRKSTNYTGEHVGTAPACSTKFEFRIESPCPFYPLDCELELDVQATSNATTNIPCDGEATATVIGGSGDYAFLWSNGNDSETATGLCDNVSYSVLILDKNTNCTALGFITMVSCQDLSASIVLNQPECLVSCDGKAIADVSNAVAPISYTWYVNGLEVSNASSINNLCDGNTISLDVIDNNGCMANAINTVDAKFETCCSTTTSYTVYDVKDAFCDGYCDGEATINVTGDLPPFTIEWDGGNTSFSRTDLCAGDNYFIIYNNEGCGVNGFVNLGFKYETCCPQINTINSIDVCPNGQFTLEAEGANSYSWSPENFIISDPNQSSIIAQVSQSTLFTVSGYLAACDEYRHAYVYVNVNADAADYRIGINPQPTYVCSWSGDYPLLAETINQNNHVLSYAWYSSAEIVCVDEICENATINLNNSRIEQYQITLKATDESGCELEANTTLYRHPGYVDIVRTMTYCLAAGTIINIDIEDVPLLGNASKASVVWYAMNDFGGYDEYSQYELSKAAPRTNQSIDVNMPNKGSDKNLKAHITDEYGCDFNYFLTIKNRDFDFNVTIDEYTCTDDSIQAHITGDFDAYQWIPDENISCNICEEPYIYILTNEIDYQVKANFTDPYNKCVIEKNVSKVLDNSGNANIIVTQISECRYKFEAIPEGFDTYVWSFGDYSGSLIGRIIDDHVFYNDGFYDISVEMSSTCTSLETSKTIEVIFEDCYCYEN